MDKDIRNKIIAFKDIDVIKYDLDSKPNEDSIRNALKVLELFTKAKTIPLSVEPSRDGGVMIEHYNDNKDYMIFELTNDDEILYLFEEANSDKCFTKEISKEELKTFELKV